MSQSAKRPTFFLTHHPVDSVDNLKMNVVIIVVVVVVIVVIYLNSIIKRNEISKKCTYTFFIRNLDQAIVLKVS